MPQAGRFLKKAPQKLQDYVRFLENFFYKNGFPDDNYSNLKC